MRAEVIPNRHGLPRLQLMIYEWLRRAPANVERLIVSSGGATVLSLTAEEVVELGKEETASRLYGQCEAIAAHNEHETAFQATWYSGNDVVILLPFKAGSGQRSTQQYDGSAVSLVTQMQHNQHLMLSWMTDSMGTVLKAQTAVIEQQRLYIERLSLREVEVQRKEEEIRSEEIAALEAMGAEENEARLERMLNLAVLIAERFGVVPEASPVPPDRRH